MGGRGSAGKKSSGGASGSNIKQGLVEGQRMRMSSSPDEVKEFTNKARPGDMVEIVNHQSGDYVGDYTLSSKGKWEQTNRYISNYAPAKSFSNEPKVVAMHFGGRDVKVVKTRKNR